jgi:hypothetical protein
VIPLLYHAIVLMQYRVSLDFFSDVLYGIIYE